MDKKYIFYPFGKHLIESVSFSMGGNETYHATGDNKPIIQHEGNDEKECYFCSLDKEQKCKKINSLSTQDFQELYGTYHKYIPHDPFYNCGVWKAYQGKNGMEINSLSDDFFEMWEKLN